MVLCSNCHGEVRPIVVFDIDGTLGDYHGHFYRFCHDYFGWPKENYRKWDGAGEFEDFLRLTKAEYREAKLAYRQGGTKRWMPVYPGAPEAVRELAEISDVWIATTRPWQRLDNIDPDTREWLRRNGMLEHISGLLYGDRKYFQLCETVDPGRIAAVVEDLPEQFAIARTLGLPVILRENDHNIYVQGSSTSYVPRGSLDVCRQWAAMRVAEWTNQYGRKGQDVHP